MMLHLRVHDNSVLRISLQTENIKNPPITYRTIASGQSRNHIKTET